MYGIPIVTRSATPNEAHANYEFINSVVRQKFQNEQKTDFK